ncbi:Hypothetical protein FKW44_016368 [Caligus rogercresseyi]|uniref:Uncharacterized protein n=1 Tax=Caligus rogercresseyi TaxID=217165 RepID=A0A7T8K0E2_CALRO|nr:Hypothetical protein FKW44_016368 [Caligus rogercresseyi]
MGPWILPNPIGVFWGYKSPAIGPSRSAEHNYIFFGYKFPANGRSDSTKHNRAVFGLQILRQWTP